MFFLLSALGDQQEQQQHSGQTHEAAEDQDLAVVAGLGDAVVGVGIAGILGVGVDGDGEADLLTLKGQLCGQITQLGVQGIVLLEGPLPIEGIGNVIALAHGAIVLDIHHVDDGIAVAGSAVEIGIDAVLGVGHSGIDGDGECFAGTGLGILINDLTDGVELHIVVQGHIAGVIQAEGVDILGAGGDDLVSAAVDGDLLLAIGIGYLEDLHIGIAGPDGIIVLHLHIGLGGEEDMVGPVEGCVGEDGLAVFAPGAFPDGGDAVGLGQGYIQAGVRRGEEGQAAEQDGGRQDHAHHHGDDSGQSAVILFSQGGIGVHGGLLDSRDQ